MSIFDKKYLGHANDHWRRLGLWMQSVTVQLCEIQKEQEKLMAILDDIKAKQAATQVDLDALLTAFNAFVAGVATGVITAADAQGILDTETTEDNKVQGLIAAVAAASNPPTP